MIFIGFFSFCYLLNSTTWHINLDGSGDFTTIQSGINASANSDTILVYTGTYYENINYNGKSLTIASLEMITGEDQYITHTTIDGQSLDSVVRLNNEEFGCCLRGFTIMNGKGNDDYPNLGGGISIFGSNGTPHVQLDIINCIIRNNTAYNSAGVMCFNGNLFLSGTIIRNNYSTYVGGGLCIQDYSVVTFDPINRCSIYDNLAITGTDIYITDDDVTPIDVYLDTFSVDQPTRYFAGSYYEEIQLTFDILNYIFEPVNHDLYVSPFGNDSNSGLSASEPMKTIMFAVRKIAEDCNDPKTVHLASGTYSVELNQQFFPFGPKSHMKISGAGISETIIDGNDEFSKLMFFGPFTENMEINNMSFINARASLGVINFTKVNGLYFKNIEVKNNFSYKNAIIVDTGQSENVIFDNVTVINNESIDHAAGISICGSKNIKILNSSFENNSVISANANISALAILFEGGVNIENCHFKSNYCENIALETSGASTVNIEKLNQEQGDILITNSLFENNTSIANDIDFILANWAVPPSKTIISNCTMVNNNATYTALCMGESYYSNTIMRNQVDFEFGLFDRTAWGIIDELSVQYSNVLDGQNSIYNQNGVNIINWLDGNIDEIPLFLESGDHPYQLTEFSPCIDVGIPDTTSLFLPPWDLLHHQRIWDGDGNGTEIIDMGCYEFGADSVGVQHNENPLANYELSNYPNPFNPQTTISFNLPESGQVNLEIFNIKGQRVKILLNNGLDQGHHEITWNGKDDRNIQVGSGVFFYKLKTDNQINIKKMILLK